MGVPIPISEFSYPIIPAMMAPHKASHHETIHSVVTAYDNHLALIQMSEMATAKQVAAVIVPQNKNA